MSKVDAHPSSAFYFSVNLGGGTAEADASFREVSGIWPEMDTAAVAEGGKNRFFHQLPKG